MGTDVTLQHPDVNGATAVELNAANVSYAWANLTKTDPEQGTYDIAETDYAGMENPKINISGTIDVDDSTANRITQNLLKDFAQARTGTTKLTLTVTTGTTPTYLTGRPTPISGKGYRNPSKGNTYLSTISCVMEGFNINFGVPDSQEGQDWTYTMILVETK